MLGPEPKSLHPASSAKAALIKHPQLVSAGTFHRRSEFKRQKPGHPQVPAQVCTPAGSQGHGQRPGDTAGAGRQRLPGIKEPHRVSSGPCKPARPLQASPRPADRPPGPRKQPRSRGGVASRKGVILLPLQPLPLPQLSPKLVLSHLLLCPQWLPACGVCTQGPWTPEDSCIELRGSIYLDGENIICLFSLTTHSNFLQLVM